MATAVEYEIEQEVTVVRTRVRIVVPGETPGLVAIRESYDRPDVVETQGWVPTQRMADVVCLAEVRAAKGAA